MNKFYVFFVLSLFPIIASAQKKSKVKYEIQAVSNIKVDADISDWKSNLYSIDSNVWSFNVAMHNGKIFAAVRIKDLKLKNEALQQGIFFNISFDNKKKNSAQLIFPIVDKELLSRFITNEYEAQNFSDQQLLNSVKGYHVSGFSKILDGVLSFDNQYDVHAAVSIDEGGNLVYESQIPLDLIKFKSNEISVHIGVNTKFAQMDRMMKNMHQRPNMSVYGRGPVTSRAVVKSPYTVATEVWFLGNLKQ